MFKKLDDLNSIISSLVLLCAVFIFPYSYWVTLGGLGALVLELILYKTESCRENTKLKIQSWYENLVNKVDKWSKQHPKVNMLYLILITLTAANLVSLDPMVAFAELFFIWLLIADYLIITKTNTWLKKTNKSNNVKYSVWAAIIIFNIIFSMLIFCDSYSRWMALYALLRGWFSWLFNMFINPLVFIMVCCVLFTAVYGIVKKVDRLNIFLTKLALLLWVVIYFGYNILFEFKKNGQFFNIVSVLLPTLTIVICFVSVYKIIRIKNKK